MHDEYTHAYLNILCAYINIFKDTCMLALFSFLLSVSPLTYWVMSDVIFLITNQRPENMMYFIIHNDTYRRNILGVHLSLPLKFGKYILYTVFNFQRHVYVGFVFISSIRQSTDVLSNVRCHISNNQSATSIHLLLPADIIIIISSIVAYCLQNIAAKLIICR
jgi:hypothetical protein